MLDEEVEFLNDRKNIFQKKFTPGDINLKILEVQCLIRICLSSSVLLKLTKTSKKFSKRELKLELSIQ